MINRGELEDRIDSYYYKKEFLDNEKRLKQIGYIKFSHLIKKITKGSTPVMTTEGIPFLKVLNMSEFGIKTKKLDFISLETHKKMKRSQLYGTEILYSMAGTIGIALNYNHKFKNANINQAISKIDLNNSNDNQLIVYLLNSNLCKLQAQRFLTVSAQPNINFEQIKSIKIPLLSTKKEIDIISIMKNSYKLKKEKEEESKALLDGIDSYLLDTLGITRSKKKKSRTFQLEFQDIFSNRLDPEVYSSNFTFQTDKYNMVLLKEYVKIDPRTSLDSVKKEEVTFLPMEKISDKYGKADTSLVQLSTDSKGYTKFKDGDLLWSKITPCMENGKSAVVNELKNRVGFGSTEYFVFRAIKEINMEYVHFLFRLKAFRENAKLFFTGSSGHQRVDKEYFLKLEIPLPHIDIQNEIAIELKARRERAKELEIEAKEVLEKAKVKVEKIILGEDK